MTDTDKQAKLLAILDKLSKANETDKDSDVQEVYDESYITKLKTSYENMLTQNTFSTGQLVKWKKGLQNRRFPKENQPAIVWEILDTPIIQDDKDSSSPYFRETLDIALALMEHDGTLLIFHYDSKRFEHF